jgi:hypothetical protein
MTSVGHVILTSILLISGLFGQSGNSGQIGDAAAKHFTVKMRTGKKFQQVIEQSFSGSWSNLALRPLFKEIAANRQIAIVLDRRIDPSAERPINVANASLRTGLEGIAKQVGGDASILENLVYVGPKSATRTLRTLIELRKFELQGNDAQISKPRRTELNRPQNFESADLDTPRELLEKFAGQSRLRVSNGQVIPHDLWAGMTLPEVPVIEALSVVLIQFDLTFRWANEGDAIELIPIPDVVMFERKYPAKKKPADVLALIRQHFPNLEAELLKNEIAVHGLLEDHEQIAGLLRGDVRKKPNKVEAPNDLRVQIFTLKAERVPVISLMKKLEESDVTFHYDLDELKKAGIDLETQVDIDVKEASAEQFFKLIFDPVGIQFQIDHLIVKLKPKK